MIAKIRERLNADEGFTLIELLVVVIIIGILAAIAIPTFLNQRESSWEKSVESDLRNAAVALETHYTENDAYPDTLDDVDDLQISSGTFLADGSGAGITYSDDGQTYCLSASHENLDGVVAAYDSDGGGLMDTPSADCT